MIIPVIYVWKCPNFDDLITGRPRIKDARLVKHKTITKLAMPYAPRFMRVGYRKLVHGLAWLSFARRVKINVQI